jgi:hypothetical protein
MPKIRLHLRILVPPSVAVTTLVSSCKKVFKQANVSIVVKSKIVLDKLSSSDQVKFTAVKVFNNCKSASVTTEQEALFALAPGIDPTDIVIFLVHSTDRAVDGCAQHPAGRPGAIVTALCTKWTMAHEIGHLLGLPHVSQSSRLMFANGTIGISANPPVLVQSEINQILGSSLVH